MERRSLPEATNYRNGDEAMFNGVIGFAAIDWPKSLTATLLVSLVLSAIATFLIWLKREADRAQRNAKAKTQREEQKRGALGSESSSGAAYRKPPEASGEKLMGPQKQAGIAFLAFALLLFLISFIRHMQDFSLNPDRYTNYYFGHPLYDSPGEHFFDALAVSLNLFVVIPIVVGIVLCCCKTPTGEDARRKAIMLIGAASGALILAYGVLLAIAIPAVNAARQQAQQMMCRGNLSQIGLAMHNYHDEHRCFPPAYIPGQDGQPIHSWRILLLPHFSDPGTKRLYDLYDFDEPWNSPKNSQLADRMPDVYRCPCEKGTHPTNTSYVMVVGSDAVSEGEHAPRAGSIKDGLSKSLLMAECGESGIPWLQPRDLEMDGMTYRINDSTVEGIRSKHGDGANVLLCDGTVQYLNESTDQETVERLIVRNDNQSPEEREEERSARDRERSARLRKAALLHPGGNSSVEDEVWMRALTERKRNEENLQTDADSLAAEEEMYVAKLASAKQAWLDGDIEQLGDILDSCLSKHRHFEWHYLKRLCLSQPLCCRGHADTVNAVAFSPDGKRIASGSTDKTIKIWNSLDALELSAISGHDAAVETVVFSPDGTRLASGGADGTLRLWDGVSGDKLFIAAAHTGPLADLAFAPDGDRIASGSADGTVRIWDINSGDQVLKIVVGSEVRSISFGPEGKRIASGSADKTLRLWDASTGDNLVTAKCDDEVQSIVFVSDGNVVLSANAQQLNVWDSDTGKKAGYPFHFSQRTINVARLSTDGRRLASGGADGIVKIWDLARRRRLAILRGHKASVQDVALSLDGNRIAIANADHTVRIWQVFNDAESFTLLGHSDEVKSIAFDPDGRQLLSASKDGTVKVWDVTSHQERLSFKSGYHWGGESVAFSRDRKRVASVESDKIVLRDTGTGDEILECRDLPPGMVAECLAVSSDGKWIALGTGRSSIFFMSEVDEGWIEVRDAITGDKVITLQQYGHSPTGLAYSPDGRRIASCTDGAAGPHNALIVWDIASGKALVSVQQPACLGPSLAFSPGGSWIACSTCGADRNQVIICSAETGEILHALGPFPGRIESIAFSQDSRRLATSHEDCVKLWDPITGVEVFTMSDDLWQVNSVAFSPDGRRLAAGCSSNGIEVWDTSSEE